MATLASIVRERKKALRYLRKLLKAVDTKIEVTQRRLKRLIARKEVVPEATDLDKLGKDMAEVDKLSAASMQGYSDVSRYFQI